MGHARNPARRERTDLVTGARRPAGAPGTEAGRLVMRVRPKAGAPLETVEVDADDLDPTRDTFGVDRGAKDEYERKAKRRAKSRKAEEREAKARRKRLAKGQLKGARATYDTPRKGAQELFDSNRGFYGEIVERGDPIDYLDGWFDTNEVKVGKRYRGLRDTKRGRELEDMHRNFSGDAVIAALAYILGKSGKRWDDVDWGAIREYNEALAESVEGSVGERFQLPAAALGLPPEAEAFLEPPEIQEQHRWMEAQAELYGAADAMEAAYKSVRKCLSKEHRRVIRARIRDVKAWADDPAIAPEWACVSQAVYCDYPMAWREVDEIEAACEREYDPDWPLRAVQETPAPLEEVPWEEAPPPDEFDVPWENPRRTIKLSPTMLSVIDTDVAELAAHPEWHGLDGREVFAYWSLMDSIHGDRLVVPEDPLVREGVRELLMDLSNTFDDAAEWRDDGHKAFNRRAASGLANLATKVSRYGADLNPASLEVR